jgi:hypothetical protein
LLCLSWFFSEHRVTVSPLGLQETRSREHGQELRAALEKDYNVVWNDQLPENALTNDLRSAHV